VFPGPDLGVGLDPGLMTEDEVTRAVAVTVAAGVSVCHKHTCSCRELI